MRPSCRSRRCRCRWRCGRASCCRAACRTTGPSSSTISARRGSSLGRCRARSRRRLLPRGCFRARPDRCCARTGRERLTTAIRAALPARPRSGATCSRRPGSRRRSDLPALWDLVWAGEVANDAWQPLRAARRYGTPKPERRTRRFARRRTMTPTATQGRWSLVRLDGEPSARALAELLLERQGIVTRDSVRAEGIPGGYGAVYGELRALETLGLCRRGYFVEGLGGAQFALGGAVERLRELRPQEGEEAEAVVLAAADPAQPYGAALPWPKKADGRAARVAGAYVVLLGGDAALFVERGGRTLVTLARARRDLAATGARGARRARPPNPSQAARSRAARRRARRRLGRLPAARGGRVHRRSAAGDPASVGARGRHAAPCGPGARRARGRADRGRGAPSPRTRHRRCPAARRAQARARVRPRQEPPARVRRPSCSAATSACGEAGACSRRRQRCAAARGSCCAGHARRRCCAEEAGSSCRRAGRCRWGRTSSRCRSTRSGSSRTFELRSRPRARRRAPRPAARVGDREHLAERGALARPPEPVAECRRR